MTRWNNNPKTVVVTYAAHAVGSLGLGGRSDEEGKRASPVAGLVMALVVPLAAPLIQLVIVNPFAGARVAA
jgi:hypothetical protein